MDFFKFRKHREDIQVERAKRDFFKSSTKNNEISYKNPEGTIEKAEHQLKHFLRTSHQKMQWQERQEKREQVVNEFVTHYKQIQSLLEKLDPVLQEYQKYQEKLQDSGISFDSLEDMHKRFQTTVGTLNSDLSSLLNDDEQDIKAFVEEKNTQMDQAKQQIVSLSLKTNNQETMKAEQQGDTSTQDHQKLGPYSDTFVKLMQQKQQTFTEFVKRLEDFCINISNKEAYASEQASTSQPASLIIEASGSGHLDTSRKALDTQFQELLDRIQKKKQEALRPSLEALQKTVNDLQKILSQDDGYKYSSDIKEKLQKAIEQAKKLSTASDATPQKLQQENTWVQKEVLQIVLEDVTVQANKLLKPYIADVFTNNAPWVQALEALGRYKEFYEPLEPTSQSYEEAEKALNGQATTKSTLDIIQELMTNTAALPGACEKFEEIIQLKEKDPDFDKQATAFSKKFEDKDKEHSPSQEDLEKFRKQYITAYVKDHFRTRCDTEKFAGLTIGYPYQEELETPETASKGYQISLQNHAQELLGLLDPHKQTEETFENKVESIVTGEIDKLAQIVKESPLKQRLTDLKDLIPSVEQEIQRTERFIQQSIEKRDLPILQEYKQNFKSLFEKPENVPLEFDQKFESLTECLESFDQNRDKSNINFAEQFENLRALIPIVQKEIDKIDQYTNKHRLKLNTGSRVYDHLSRIQRSFKSLEEPFKMAKDLQKDKAQLDQTLKKDYQAFDDLKTVGTHLQDVNKTYILLYAKYQYFPWSRTDEAQKERTLLNKNHGYLTKWDAHCFVSESCEIFCTFHKQELLTHLDPEKGTGNTFKSEIASKFKTILSIERVWQDTAKRYPQALQDLPEIVKGLMAVKFLLMKYNQDYCFKIIEGWQEEMKENNLTIDQLLTDRETKRGYRLRVPIDKGLEVEEFMQYVKEGRHMLDPGGGPLHGSHPHRMQFELAATAIDQGRIEIPSSIVGSGLNWENNLDLGESMNLNRNNSPIEFSDPSNHPQETPHLIVHLYTAIANEKFYDTEENRKKDPNHRTIWNSIFDYAYSQLGGYNNPLNIMLDIREKLSSGPLKIEIARDLLRQNRLGFKSVFGEKELKEALIEKLAEIKQNELEKEVDKTSVSYHEYVSEDTKTNFRNFKKKLEEKDLSEIENLYIEYGRHHPPTGLSMKYHQVAQKYQKGIDKLLTDQPFSDDIINEDLERVGATFVQGRVIPLTSPILNQFVTRQED